MLLPETRHSKLKTRNFYYKSDMKNRIVIWGKNEQDERVLIALELKPEANKVNLHTFPESVAGDDFTKKMMETWRSGAEVEFPEGATTVVRDLAVTESLLPENLKVDRSDIINRAQSEWHFVVLSHKMSQVYQSELAELREKVNAMTAYDKKAWDGVKAFWDKVSEQVKDRNLFREHSDNLRDGINELFEQLKTLRAQADVVYKETSGQVLSELNSALDAVEAKIQSGGGRFSTVFDDLKALQSKYRQSKMTREDGDKIWNRLDAAFKAAKERRFGPGANEGSVSERHERRLAGLVDAIKKMQQSVDRDAEDLKYEERRIAASAGQLEAQIRTAKIKMVRERLISKEEKLADMKKTQAEVLAQIEQAKVRDAKRSEKDAERASFQAAKEEAKARIDAEAKAAKEAPVEKGTIEKAADATVDFAADVAEKGSSILGALGSVFGDALEDLGDTMKAVAEVVGEKAAPMAESISEKISEAMDSVAEKAAPIAKAASEKFAEAVDAVQAKADEVMADNTEAEKPVRKAKRVTEEPAEEDEKKDA